MTIAPEGRTATSLAQRVAAEIRAEMGRRNLSINGFAAHLGVTHPWLWRRLRGNQPLTLDELETIGRALRVTPEELIGRAVAMQPARRVPTDEQVMPPIRLRPATYPVEHAGPPERTRRPFRLAA
jgi:transcriptional regulator with XRE-family HTH domain